MLRRGNLESLHQPIMPFKWRPFDLYNNVNIDTHHCNIDKQFELPNDSNGKRTYYLNTSPNHQIRTKARNYRIFNDSCQPDNSRSSNQSSDSSCNSQQTAGHYITNSDNINSINMSLMSTIKLCENYRKLFCQSDCNQTNSKCERSHCMHRHSISDTSTSCSHSIDSDINCCCSTILRNLRRICLDSMGDGNGHGNGNKNTNKNARTNHYLHRNQVNHYQIVNNNNNSKATTLDENHSKLVTSITNRYDSSNYSFGSTANNLNNNGDNSYDLGSSGELNSLLNENKTNDGSEFNSK